MSREYQQKILQIPPDLLLDMFKDMDGTPQRIKCEGLPRDARVIRSFVDERKQWLATPTISIVVESKEFPASLEGMVLPELVLRFERIK